jgi:hypothetical protein
MAQNSNINESTKLRKKVDKQLQTPLDVSIRTNDIHDSYTARRGKWVHPDEDDDIIQLHKDYQDRVNAGGSNLGKLVVDKSLLTTIKKKKDQESYTREVQLANYLIDKDIPESQERVFQIYNELKDVPDQQFADDIEQQESLRIMLRDGAIRGKDDHAFILRILEPDFFLPTSPIWDDDRRLIEKYMNQVTVDDVLTYIRAVQSPSVYNPVTYAYSDRLLADIAGIPFPPGAPVHYPGVLWAVDVNTKIPNFGATCAIVHNAITKMKLDIALRLYPGLRNWWKRDCAQNARSEDLLWYNDNGAQRSFRAICRLYTQWYAPYFILRSNPIVGKTKPEFLSFLP